jgi:hypothetical protein
MFNYFFKNLNTLFLTCALAFISIANAQEVRVIDNKGTIKTVNNNQVTTDIAPAVPILEGDVWVDISATPNILKVWDGDSWISINGQFWSLQGNTGTDTTTDFIGTADDVRMQFRSNNTPILELGKRETLGLTASYPDYTNVDQSLAYLKGLNGVSALQFEATNASFYKPMFFTTSNGSFRLKGSAGGTDLFEIGSAGPTNDGRLEFIIGDDGNEPIIFKRYDYRNGEFNKEFFRVQGSNGSADAKTRFGININPTPIPIDITYDVSQLGLNIANSTLQVNGSISASIIKLESAGDFTLTEDHYTVIISSDSNIILPTANSCKGRTYILKNISGSTKTTSINYKNNSNTDSNLINNNSTINLQSDGTDWTETSAINGPEIIAAGKVGPTSTNIKVFNATVTRVLPASVGEYQVTFDSPLDDANYIIQLTIISAFGDGNDDPDLSYYDQQTTGFKVETGNNDNGGSDRDEQDFEFMFTVIDF